MTTRNRVLLIAAFALAIVIGWCAPTPADHPHSVALNAPADTFAVVGPDSAVGVSVADSAGVLQFDGVGAGRYTVAEALVDSTQPCPPDTVVVYEPVYICERCEDPELRGDGYSYLLAQMQRPHRLGDMVLLAHLVYIMSCDQLRELTR